MIFIWTFDGGPLQYIGIFLFLFFQIIPHFSTPLLPEMIQDIPSNLNPSPTNDNGDTSTSSSLIDIFTIFIFIALGLTFLSVVMVMFRMNILRSWRSHPRQVRVASNDNRSPIIPWASAGMICGILAGVMFWWFQMGINRNQDVFGMISDAYMIFLSLTQMVGFGYLVYLMLQNFNYNYAQGRNNRPDQNEANRRRTRIATIVSRIHGMPVEEFCKDEETSYACLSISQLREMMRVRGMIQDQAFLERSEVVAALRKCRKYSDACCICCEEYEENTDILRILPRCNHGASVLAFFNGMHGEPSTLIIYFNYLSLSKSFILNVWTNGPIRFKTSPIIAILRVPSVTHRYKKR
jgi:hypothetical protein